MSATGSVFLRDVPYTFRIPEELRTRVESAPLTDAWTAELAPLAATQLTFRSSSGEQTFLGNVFWFAAARYDALVTPDSPPPGLEVARTHDRVLAIAATVEMPFVPESSDGRAYGRIAELLRAPSAFVPLARCAADVGVVRELSAAVRRAIVDYYTAKDLDPVVFPEAKETLLDIEQHRLGIHACTYVDGGVSAWTGDVPMTANAAVRVFVRHEPYPVTDTPANFVTVARMPSGRWEIVGEATSP